MKVIKAFTETTNDVSEIVTTIAGNLGTLVSQFSVKEPTFDIAQVKSAHLDWKVKLETVLNGRKKMQSDEVSTHHECEFGHWYDKANQEVIDSPAYAQVGVHHKAVYDTAKEIVTLYNAEQSDAAHEKLKEFNDSQRKLFECIDELYAS